MVDISGEAVLLDELEAARRPAAQERFLQIVETACLNLGAPGLDKISDFMAKALRSTTS